MGYRPGRACAAGFSIKRRAPSSEEDAIPSLLRQAQFLQRFWLTATQLGLVLEPCMATLALAYYGHHGIGFTEDPKILGQARSLAQRLPAIGHAAASVDEIILMGRIGTPVARRVKPRSVRRPLEELLTPAGAKHEQVTGQQRATG
jgi:hypothetical protein